MGAPEHRHEGHALELHIIGVVPLAPNQAQVFLALDGGAHQPGWTA
jgi:hypothetical protein